MSSNVFPISKIEDNKLTSLKGDESGFYNLRSVDLEQLSDFDIGGFYKNLSKSLNNIEQGKFFKFYRINRENYLNTDSNITHLSFELKNCSDPLGVFFEDTDFYSGLGIYDDYLSYSGLYKRVISVKGFGDGSIDLLSIPQDIDYVLLFRKLSDDKASKRLELIRSSHQSVILKSKRDFLSEGAYNQAEELIYNLTHKLESIFDMELYFLPKGLSLNELNKETMNLIQGLNQLGVTSYIEGHNLKKFKSGLGEIYKELIPGVKPRFRFRSLPNKTSHLVNLIPLHRSVLMDQGIEFLDTGFNEIFLDLFSKQFKNRNILVTGSSGGGKSVLVNKIVNSLLPNHPAVILDKGGSFKKLCLYHNGINLHDKINPMDFRCPYYLREFILSVVDMGEFNKLRRGLLLKEIKAFFTNYNGNSFFDLLDHLESEFEGVSLYFEDIKDFITTDKCKINNLLYVDIERFPKTQVSPLIIYVLEYFKNIDKKEKILVFDEAWKFLKGHEEYIDEKFREIRKSGAMAIAIAQGFKDFSNLNSQLYTSLTNNSFFKFFFSQDYIEDADITDFDNEMIKFLEYEKNRFSDCYLKTQSEEIRKIIRIFLSPLEYELFHTEDYRNDLFFGFYKDNRKYFASNKDTIDAFVRLHHETV